MSTLHGQMSVGYISYRLTHLFSAQHPCFLSVIPPMPVTSLTPKKSCRCHLVVGEASDWVEGVVRLMSLGRSGWWTRWVVKSTGAYRGNWPTKSIDRPGNSWLVINCCHFGQMACNCMLFRCFIYTNNCIKTLLKYFSNLYYFFHPYFNWTKKAQSN